MLFFRCDLRFFSMIALLVGAGAAAGCGSNCGTNCPNTYFNVAASVGDNLNVQTATWIGPACPTDSAPYCRGNIDGSLPCVDFTILGIAPGTCELDLTFSDGRYPFKAIAQFGPATHQGCCQGFPVVGSALATIPLLHPIIQFDASPDGDGGDDGGTTDAPSD